MKKQLILPLILLFLNSIYGMENSKKINIQPEKLFKDLQKQKIDIKDDRWIRLLGTVAINGGCNNLLKQILKKGVDPNQGTSPALYNACFSGALNNVITLLEHNADPDKPDSSLNDTPLMLSLRHGYHEIFNLLLEKGANPNLKDKLGFTALIYACVGEVFDDIINDRKKERISRQKPDIFNELPLDINDSDLRNELIKM